MWTMKSQLSLHTHVPHSLIRTFDVTHATSTFYYLIVPDKALFNTKKSQVGCGKLKDSIIKLTYLTFKALITAVADDTLNFVFIIIFQSK